MLRPLLGAAALVASIAALASACKSSSTSGGPPCQGADADQSCYDCQSSRCASAFAQVEADCGDFLACEAQCQCGDISCLEACSAKITGACASADSALQSCAQGSCAAACSHTSGSDGGTTAPNCSKLATCCPTLPANAVDGCNTVVSANNDSICSQQLANYQAATYCGSSSGTGSCSDLATCCAAISDTNVKMGCQQVVQLDMESTCASELNAFHSAGYCP